MTRISFLHPGSINRLSGGTIYDKKLINAIRELNSDISINLFEIQGEFPFVTNQTLQNFKEIKAELDNILIVDGLSALLLYENSDIFNNHTVVYLFHNPLHLGNDFQKEDRDFLQKAELKVLNRCDTIITTSLYSKNYLTKYVENIQILNLSPGKPTMLHTKKKSTNELKNLLMVGSISPVKNIHYLLDAIKNIDQTLRVDIVGPISDPSYLEIIKEKIQKIKQHEIKLHGGVQDLNEYYQKADLFIHVPKQESYGMVLQEAMAFNLPIVTTEIGGIPQTVGDAAILIPIDDVDQLTFQLKQILGSRELRKNLSEKSGKRFTELPSWKDQAKVLIEHLKLFV